MKQLVGMARFELATPSSRTRCAARLRYIPNINRNKLWSEWRDSNSRPPGPKPGALPDCATLRPFRSSVPPDMFRQISCQMHGNIIFIRCPECNAESHHTPSINMTYMTAMQHSAWPSEFGEGLRHPPNRPSPNHPVPRKGWRPTRHTCTESAFIQLPGWLPASSDRSPGGLKARKTNNVKERDHCMKTA